MENLFISYRRDDASAYAGRICDHLTALIGEKRVFMDVEAIRPGQNFAQAIEQTLASCSHVFVVIGPRWHEILEARAQQSAEDYVVHEISAALKQNKIVVPVFVGGASPTALTALPSALADLPLHQAIELRDSSFNEDCDRLAAKLKLSHRTRRNPLWSVVAAAVLGLLTFLAARNGLGPWHASHERALQVSRYLSTAQTDLHQTEYESAFQAFQQALTLDPNNGAALDGEVDAAMLWLDHFHVLTPEGQKSEDIAAPVLAQLNTVLTAGLARTHGKDKRAADILAHLGWMHYMNEKIAFKEFGNAERWFAQSLAIDPNNVYAHMFYGNWLFQTRGDSAQAVKHFNAALATNKERELVRQMQLGGLLHNDDAGMRAEFVRALNQVRVGNEPLDSMIRDRVSYLYSPTVSDAGELQETLTAVAPEDAWKTFLWLNPKAPLLADFIRASLDEISGSRDKALSEFKSLSNVLSEKRVSGRMTDCTAAAINRLSH